MSDHHHPLPEVPLVRGRMHWVLERCRGERVLHLGCADEGLTADRLARGEHLHAQLSEVAQELWGVDRSEVGLALIERHLPGARLIRADLEQLDEQPDLLAAGFTRIVLTEVVEHLDNPGRVLDSVRALCRPETRLLLSVPNGLSLLRLLDGLHRQEVVHPDHVAWFSYRTLRTLLERHGFVIDELAAYHFFAPASGLYPKLRQLPRRLLRAFARQRSPLLVADGILVQARVGG